MIPACIAIAELPRNCERQSRGALWQVRVYCPRESIK
jgi:hypothetical protein